MTISLICKNSAIASIQAHLLRFVLLLFILTSYLFASTPFDFTKDELLLVKQKYGQIALNRIDDFEQNLHAFKKLSQKQKLLFSNRYLNQLLPQHDYVIQNSENYWATPKEFLSIGFGDCEDYVIIKYFALVELGFDEDALFFATVKDSYNGQFHMVLLFYDDDKKPPLVLDNMSHKVLPLDVRVDITPKEAFNKSGYYLINQNGAMQKKSLKYPPFEKLLREVKTKIVQ